MEPYLPPRSSADWSSIPYFADYNFFNSNDKHIVVESAERGVIRAASLGRLIERIGKGLPRLGGRIGVDGIHSSISHGYRFHGAPDCPPMVRAVAGATGRPDPGHVSQTLRKRLPLTAFFPAAAGRFDLWLPEGGGDEHRPRSFPIGASGKTRYESDSSNRGDKDDRATRARGLV